MGHKEKHNCHPQIIYMYNFHYFTCINGKFLLPVFASDLLTNNVLLPTSSLGRNLHF